MGKTLSDEYGEYDEDAGSPHPVNEEEVGYVPCNAVLKHTFSRYGERRYCMAMAIENFESNGTETDYEHGQFCKNHQSRAALMKQHAENFKTGAYTKSHQHIFQHLPPHKQIIANDLYRSLLDESTYSFETESVNLEIDVSDSDFGGPETDAIVMDHPVPTDKAMEGKALWHASLDFITMESIRKEQFRVSAEETGPDGEPLAIGETTKVVTVTDDGREIEDKDEHHLNIALSRITSNYEKHMRFGGVEYDGEDNQADMGAREWVAVVEPEESPAPEAASAEQSPLEEIEVPESDEDA